MWADLKTPDLRTRRQSYASSVPNRDQDFWPRTAIKPGERIGVAHLTGHVWKNDAGFEHDVWNPQLSGGASCKAEIAPPVAANPDVRRGVKSPGKLLAFLKSSLNYADASGFAGSAAGTCRRAAVSNRTE